MNKIIALIFLIGLVAACVHEKNDIIGTWIDADFSHPQTLTFSDSLWDTSEGFDPLPYYLRQDSIFLHVFYRPELTKLGYRVSGDTLWTIFKADSQIYTTQYFKQKSEHFFNDIKAHLKIDLDLPKGYSKLVGLRFGASIYFPKQKTTDSNYTIFLNNEQLTLDTILHEKLFKLLDFDPLIRSRRVGLYIDTKIECGAVKLLKNELRKVGFNKVAFVSDALGEKYYESNVGIESRLYPIPENEDLYINPDIREIVDKRKPPNPPKYFFETPDFKKPNVCKVEILDNQIFLNEQKFNVDIYHKELKEDNPFFVYLKVDNGSSYGTYYSFISTHDSLRQVIKNEISVDLYKNRYDELSDMDKIKKIDSLSKIRLIETKL